MADAQKHARNLEFPLLPAGGAGQANPGHAVLIGAQHLVHRAVPRHFNLGIFQSPLFHDFRGAQFIPTVHQIHFACKFGQVACFFHRRVATTHHHQLLVAEAGQGAVAHRAGGNAVVLEPLLAGQAQPVGPCTRGNDHRVRLNGAVFQGLQVERPLGEIHLCHIIGDDARAKIHRLLPHQLHQLRAGHPVGRLIALVQNPERLAIFWQRGGQVFPQVAGRKPREILDFRGEIQLAQGQGTFHAVFFSDRPFHHQRVQVGPGAVDGSGPAGRA